MSKPSESGGAFFQEAGVETVGLLGPIPQVARAITIGGEQVAPEFGHVTAPGQSQIYFDELMRVMDARGVGFFTLMEHGIRASVGEMNLSCLRELKAGDEVTITTDISEHETQLQFDQAMARNRKNVGSLSTTVNLRAKLNFPTPIPDWVKVLLRTDIDVPESSE